MLSALLVVLAAIALGISPVWDYDVWFHLACGRDIVAARGIPPFDTLSYTAAQRPWDAHEWLFDVALFGLWQAGGFNLLIAVKAAFAGSFGWLLYRRATRDLCPDTLRWIAAGLVVWGLWVCRWSIVERPQLLTFVFVSFELLMLESGRTSWLLVPLEILWANLHGGSALLGPGVLGLHLTGQVFGALQRGAPWRPAIAGWPVAVAMLAAIALTPTGFRLYAYPLETMRDTMYLSNILEWMPPTRHEAPEFFVWFGACAVLAGIAARGAAWADLAVALPLAILPWTARRHIPLAVIALVPLAARGAALVLARPFAWRGFAAGAAVAAAIACVTFAARQGEALRLGVREDLYPAAVVPLLRAGRPEVAPGRPVKVYALHRWGGYCAWHLNPDFRTLIDGRQLVFGPELFADYNRILEDLPETGDLLDRYAPDVFILNYGARLSRRLAADSRFSLVHWDDTAVVYARRSITGTAWIGRHAYRAFHPESAARGTSAAVLAELARAVAAAPGHTRPLIARSRVLLELKHPAEALDVARSAVAIAPTSPAVLLGAVDAALAGGLPDLAGGWIAAARRAGAAPEDSGLADAKLAAARGDLGFAEQALVAALAAAEARQVLTRTPPTPLVEICGRLAALRRAAGDRAGAAALLRRQGNALYTLGDQPAALASYRAGLALAPDDARLQHNLGTVLLALNRVGEAIAAFRRALATDAAQTDTWAALGHALHIARQFPGAAAAWRRALELDPAREDVRQALAGLDGSPR